jgi:alpha-galactosidase
VLAHGAYADHGPTGSGGGRVQRLGGENSGTAEFDHVTVPVAGLYPMTVLYTVGDDRSLVITVNANAQFDVILSRAVTRRNRDASSSRTILAPLNAGENTIAFGNPEEPGPDLDRLIIGGAPVSSGMISGRITRADGSPLPKVEVRLSGPFQMKALTDAQGRYEFPFLPKGDYYVRPVSSQNFFSPFENFFPLRNTNADNLNFAARQPGLEASAPLVVQRGKWRVEYDLANGTADVFHAGKRSIAKAFAVVRRPETVTSMDYKIRRAKQESIHDGFGCGVRWVVESTGGGAEKMIQTFWLYPDADYFLAEVALGGDSKIASNFMSPLTSQTPVDFSPVGDHRALFVPFDNDKWTRYNAIPFGGEVASYEVTALYDSASRRGLILGSIEHDRWKTAVRSTTASNVITSLEIFGGVASSKTRDVLPHGKISGTTIRSPKVFVGLYSDWRDGLEAYAKANATAAPPRVWLGGMPFGWNSWGKLQGRISYAKAVQVSDFFARELPQFENGKVIYVGLDSGWNQFTDEQLKQFVDHCTSNHQAAGIYLTPFSTWHGGDDDPVRGTDYQFKDLFLLAHGQKQWIDGGIALDPTHPGTKQLIQSAIARFKQAGFKYVKADFLTHGALEADRYFNPQVTTGMQAYNEGMKFVSETLGPEMYFNLSISPLFPAQYANSRRISCDTFGAASQTEYMLNSLSYGWWLSKVYDFNDADHVVLDGYSEGENRLRTTASVITGIFISGDDFSAGGGATGKARAKQFLNNAEVNAVAKMEKSFRPVEGDTANHATRLFSFTATNGVYLAAFNFERTNASIRVDLNRLGIRTDRPVQTSELWSGATTEVSNPMIIQFNFANAALYKFYNVQPPEPDAGN